LYATPRWAGAPAAVHARGEVTAASRRPPRRGIRRTRILQAALVATGALVIGGLSTAYGIGGAALPAHEAVAEAREYALLYAPREAASSRSVSHHAEAESQAALEWMASAGWLVPESLPEGYVVTWFDISNTGEETLQAMVATPTGSITFTVRHSRIDPAEIGDLQARTIGRHTVYCQEVDGQLAGATNAGGEFLVFVSNATERELATVLQHAPAPRDLTATTRISRGLAALLT
jgi:hypothetical protein